MLLVDLYYQRKLPYTEIGASLFNNSRLGSKFVVLN